MKQAELTQRTRSSMASSLKKLLTEKSVRKITVREIIEDCGINRQTFYYHFRDVSDLLNWTFEQEARQLIAHCETCAWEERLRQSLEYLAQNANICVSALDGMGRDPLYRFMHMNHEDMLYDMIEELAVGMNVSERYKRFLAEFYVEAISGVAFDWMCAGMPVSISELIEQVQITMQGNMICALRRADAEGK